MPVTISSMPVAGQQAFGQSDMKHKPALFLNRSKFEPTTVSTSKIQVNLGSPFIMEAALPSSVTWDLESLCRRDEDEAGLSTSPQSAFSDWDSEESITDSEYEEDDESEAQYITIRPGCPFHAPVSRPPLQPLKLTFDLKPIEEERMSFACDALGLEDKHHPEAKAFHEEIITCTPTSSGEDALAQLEIQLAPPPPALSFLDTDSPKRRRAALQLPLHDRHRSDLPVDLDCEEEDDGEDGAVLETARPRSRTDVVPIDALPPLDKRVVAPF